MIKLKIFLSAVFSVVFVYQTAASINNIKLTKKADNLTIPTYIEFEKGKEPYAKDIKNWLVQNYKMDTKFDFIFLSKEIDQIGFTHYKYQQTYNGYPIETTRLILHTKQEKVISLNGLLFDAFSNKTPISVAEKGALLSALKLVNAKTYKWQSSEEEKNLKVNTNNPNASYYPKAQLVYVVNKNKKQNVALCYKFDIYAITPLYRAYVYVDAAENKVIKVENRIHHNDVPGTAITAYSGTQTITVDYVSTNNYRLRETGRGNGIETYNCLQQENNTGSVDFIDTDNIWNNVNAQYDQYATDAHWGAEKTYDYFFINHNRNSIDNNGFKIKSYIHYGSNFANAFWDGNVMTYGDGTTTGTVVTTPFTTCDITGHEITHGLTEFSAGLLYEGESGALNEGFSDIFGQTIEFYAKPSTASWLIGEETGYTIRNMANPNAYENPDTYHGNFWDFTFEEVHNTSGVANFWYYLLVTGGSGTNDIGNNYSVTGIGLTNASKIAYRCLTVYLTPTSNYEEARFYSLQSAIDLFGPCSPEVVATGNAWYAVGVGAIYTNSVQSIFSALTPSVCAAPQNIQFSNLSNNGVNFMWYFGDGTTSTNVSPNHTYNANGTYSVTLVTFGGTCGKDSVTKTNYISVSPNNPCLNNLINGVTYTGCNGFLYDDGGPFGKYSNGDPFNTDKLYINTTLQATAGNLLSIQFDEFKMEADYDTLYIYEGIGTNGNMLGAFSGFNLPYAGSIFNTSTNAITIVQVSDGLVNFSGFKMNWFCNNNVGLNEVIANNNSVIIAPNPTSAFIQINYKSESKNPIVLKLTDAVGKILHQNYVYKLDTDGYNTTLNLSDYSNGIYFVNIIDNNKINTEKIILNK